MRARAKDDQARYEVSEASDFAVLLSTCGSMLTFAQAVERDRRRHEEEVATEARIRSEQTASRQRADAETAKYREEARQLKLKAAGEWDVARGSGPDGTDETAAVE